MTNIDPVPGIAEADATGQIAELYADIRETVGCGVVNLIWRNLATVPEALPWVWHTVKPLYLGSAQAHAEAVRRGLALPRVPPFPPEALAVCGIDAEERATIRVILDSYFHTNALALVTLSSLLLFYDPVPAAAPGQPYTGPVARPRGAVPALPDRLNPEICRVISMLNGFGEDAEPGLTATMYRLLGRFPAYLALVHTKLAPLEADGSLRALVRAVRAQGRAHGATLARVLTPAEPPPTAARALSHLRRFTQHPIARMTGICALMREATPA